MKRTFLANFQVDGNPLPKEIVDAILDENSRDIGAVKSQYEDYDTLKKQLEDGHALVNIKKFLHFSKQITEVFP